MQSSRLFMTIGATGLALATIASVAPASAATHPLPDWQDLDPTIATVARHDVRYTSNDGPGTVAVTDAAPRISVPALGYPKDARLEVRDTTTDALVCAADGAFGTLGSDFRCTPDTPLAGGVTSIAAVLIAHDGALRTPVSRTVHVDVDAPVDTSDPVQSPAVSDVAFAGGRLTGVAGLPTGESGYLRILDAEGKRVTASFASLGNRRIAFTIDGASAGATYGAAWETDRGTSEPVSFSAPGTVDPQPPVVGPEEPGTGTTRPDVERTAVDAAGGLTVDVRTHAAGMVVVKDDTGKERSMTSGNANSGGALVQQYLVDWTPGATYTVVHSTSNGSELARTTFTAPGAATEEPGTDPEQPGTDPGDGHAPGGETTVRQDWFDAENGVAHLSGSTKGPSEFQYHVLSADGALVATPKPGATDKRGAFTTVLHGLHAGDRVVFAWVSPNITTRTVTVGA